MKKPSLTLLVQIVCIAAIIIVAIVQWNRACTTVTPTDSEMSSHGWGVWFGESLQSFVHEGKRICVPEGWASVGEIRRGPTWAMFPVGQSAVLVRPEAFGTVDLTFENSAYRVRVMYPIEMTEEMLAPYLATITHAFERVGAFYPDATEPYEHTVLISVGLAGEAMDFESTLYPEPGPTLSTLARAFEHKRSEELFTHAVAHLYNRQRTDLIAYEHVQEPIPAEDFQELEASWIELYVRSDADARMRRLNELYAIHQAVFMDAYMPNLLYPFSEVELFDEVTRQNVVLPAESSYSDFQYGHYILAPLSIIAIDGLLLERGAPVDMADIFTTVHMNGDTHLLNEVARYLTPEDMEQIRRWMSGEELIPRNLVDHGVAQY